MNMIGGISKIEEDWGAWYEGYVILFQEKVYMHKIMYNTEVYKFYFW